ncbi:MAG: GDYXXLXY domain-containing protein [Oscillospiraceae bacterium]|nr:GDYXXLXY domain-containing protein [Oscillospiraceae bacterium]
MKKHILILTIAYFIVLLAVPIYMIYDYYNILSSGEVYKVRVTAYDPYDPFRGRYVAIRPEHNELRWGENSVILIKDGNDFVTRVVNNATGAGSIKNFKLERYYMNEKTAPKLEERLLRRNIQENDTVYVTIRVKGGRYVVEGMYINGIAVEEYIYDES